MAPPRVCGCSHLQQRLCRCLRRPFTFLRRECIAAPAAGYGCRRPLRLLRNPASKGLRWGLGKRCTLVVRAGRRFRLISCFRWHDSAPQPGALCARGTGDRGPLLSADSISRPHLDAPRPPGWKPAIGVALEPPGVRGCGCVLRSRGGLPLLPPRSSL